MQKKSTRVLSLIAALLLIGLILAGLIFAFLDVEWAGVASLSCFLAVLVLSVLLYGIKMITRHIKGKNS